MEDNKLGQEPAFPMVNLEGLPGLITEEYSDFTGKEFTNGISKREYAAIYLKVPDSGEEWLDEMIKKSIRRETIIAAMQGLLANPNLAYQLQALGAKSAGDSNKAVAISSCNLADVILKQENA